MKKKIIVISYFFGPANKIGAIRWTKLSKYFTEIDDQLELSVITSKNKNIMFLEKGYVVDPILKEDIEKLNIIEIEHSKLYKQLASFIYSNLSKNESTVNKEITSKHKLSIISRLKKTVLHYGVFFLQLIQDLDFYNQIKKKDEIFTKDVILITTYGPLGNLLVGLKYNKKIKSWIADFRDPIAQNKQYKLEKIINGYFEKKVMKQSSKVVAVTKGYMDSIRKDCERSLSHKVITNGFDPDDFQNMSIDKGKEELSFVYTGTLYSGRRDLTIIFEILREMINDEKIKMENLIFNYAGSQFHILESMARVYDLSSILIDHGFVDRKRSLDIQNKSDILVVATWHDTKGEGVVPGKFLEYLGFNKPILGIVYGKEKNSELSSRIEEVNQGMCYEEAIDNKDQLIEFILSNYNGNKKRTYSTRLSYSYKELAKDYLKFMDEE